MCTAGVCNFTLDTSASVGAHLPNVPAGAIEPVSNETSTVLGVSMGIIGVMEADGGRRSSADPIDTKRTFTSVDPLGCPMTSAGKVWWGDEWGGGGMCVRQRKAKSQRGKVGLPNAAATFFTVSLSFLLHPSIHYHTHKHYISISIYIYAVPFTSPLILELLTSLPLFLQPSRCANRFSYSNECIDRLSIK